MITENKNSLKKFDQICRTKSTQKRSKATEFNDQNKSTESIHRCPRADPSLFAFNFPHFSIKSQKLEIGKNNSCSDFDNKLDCQASIFCQCFKYQES